MASNQKEAAIAQPAAKPVALRWDGHMSDGVGATYGAEPMAFLSAEPEALLLCGTRGTFKIPRTAVVKLSRGGFYPWFFKGIRIRHQVSNFPNELVFKPQEAKERDLLSSLRAMGYPAG